MDVTLLFTIEGSVSERDEFQAASRCMRTETSRVLCKDSTVYGRFSVSPHYRTIEADIANVGGRLINSYEQHRWVANFEYYFDLKNYTFESWDDKTFPNSKHEGPFVVKGVTTSKKHHWDTMMFAKDRREAIEVASRLSQDEFIGRQRIIYRKYTPLVTYEIGLNGLRFTNEWRLFFLGENLISYGYYWTEAEDVTTPLLSEEGLSFARKVAKVASRYCNFYVLDIGEKEEGGWVLVEVNDGQQSGLSMIEPDEFYSNLAMIAASFDHR